LLNVLDTGGRAVQAYACQEIIVDSWFTLATNSACHVLSRGGRGAFFGPNTSTTATLGE
jgi:hypothetical protein